MSRRSLSIAGWLTLLAGAVAAATATVLAVVGVMALSGKLTYPVDVGIGPFSLQNTLSIPVEIYGDVCQSADVDEQNVASECFRFFLHEGDAGRESIRRQDADARPVFAAFNGEAELTTTGGWSPLVAASVSSAVLGLVVISGALFMLWQILRATAAGEAFSRGTVRYLRGIGWLVIAGALLQPGLDHFTSADQLGYGWESFGVEPGIMLLGSGGYLDGLNVWQIALGCLSLLLAEVFRYGATIEEDRRLTV